MRPRVCDAGACEAGRLYAGLNSSLRLIPVTRVQPGNVGACRYRSFKRSSVERPQCRPNLSFTDD